MWDGKYGYKYINKKKRRKVFGVYSYHFAAGKIAKRDKFDVRLLENPFSDFFYY